MSKDLDLKKEKVFLVVFHGGMVGYLWLHNLAIPLIRNLGQGKPILLGIHFWFAYHTIILFSFIKYDFKKFQTSLIPFLIDSALCTSIFGILHMGFEFSQMERPNLAHFSSTISLASIMIFFMGFFLHFKKFINWEVKSKVAHYLASIAMGVAFFLFFYNLELHFSNTPEWAKKEVPTPVVEKVKKVNPGPEGCDSNFKTLKFPLPTSGNLPLQSEIKNCGLFPNIVTTGPEGIGLSNGSPHNAHLRLELHKGSKWALRKIVKLKKGESTLISTKDFKEAGIYRLKSATGENLGVQAILHRPSQFQGNSDIPME